MNIQSIPTPAMHVPPRSPAPPPPVARIAKISLSDFRAFPSGPRCEIDLGAEGKNLLLYGENGSGKSSLARALRDLFNHRNPPASYESSRNIFTAGEEGAVSVQFTAGVSPAEFRWEFGEAHPKTKEGQAFFEFASRSLFLDYRDLLQTSFGHPSGPPNLFSLLVGAVLDALPVLVGGRQKPLGEVHRQLVASLPRRHYRGLLDRTDFACRQMTAVLTAHLPEVVEEANRIFVKLGHHGTKFMLTPKPVTYARTTRSFAGCCIEFEVELFGRKIAEPQHFLNEARLTALALAIYLGAAKRTILPPAAPVGGALPTRLLVLDDVLIGLDLANRLPLLRVLAEEFAEWQIILLTHDRVWFELAREHTEGTGRWAAKELCLLDSPEGVPPRPVLKDSDDLLDRACAHLGATPPDLMAAAVYVRAAFENRLRNVAEKQGIKVPFKHQLKDIKADQLWLGILDRQKERADQQQRHPGNQIPDFIPAALVADVETMRSTILNRLSHTGAPTLVKSEIEFALRTVRTLQGHSFPKVSTVHP